MNFGSDLQNFEIKIEENPSLSSLLGTKPLEIQFVTIVFCWSGIRATHWGNLLLTPYAPDHDSIGQAATSLIWQSVAKTSMKPHLKFINVFLHGIFFADFSISANFQIISKIN